MTMCGIFFSILSLKLPIKVIESNFYILFKLNLTALLFTTNWLGWIVWKLKPHVIKHNKKVGYRILRRQLKAWNVKSQSRCCFWTHTIYILERSGISTQCPLFVSLFICRHNHDMKNATTMNNIYLFMNGNEPTLWVANFPKFVPIYLTLRYQYNMVSKSWSEDRHKEDNGTYYWMDPLINKTPTIYQRMDHSALIYSFLPCSRHTLTGHGTVLVAETSTALA